MIPVRDSSYPVYKSNSTTFAAFSVVLFPKNISSAMSAIPFSPAQPDDILSWTKRDKDCRDSKLFNGYGVLYEFEVLFVTLIPDAN